MINFQSLHWKNIIKKDIACIKKMIAKNFDNYANKDKLEDTFSKIEIKIYIIAYSLRKLLDTKKVTDKLSNSRYKIDSYPKTRKKITHTNHHRLEDHYIFEKKTKLKMTIREICNTIIHSYIFQLIFSRKKFTYIYFASDYTKNRALFNIKINKFLQIAEKFTKNYPKKINLSFDEKIDDYKISVK